MHVTEGRVMVLWMSQPPPGTELVVVVTSSPPSESVLRLRSMTSPLMAGDALVESRGAVGSSWCELLGR
jgi:hypothetical protein